MLHKHTHQNDTLDTAFFLPGTSSPVCYHFWLLKKRKKKSGEKERKRISSRKVRRGFSRLLREEI